MVSIVFNMIVVRVGFSSSGKSALGVSTAGQRTAPEVPWNSNWFPEEKERVDAETGLKSFVLELTHFLDPTQDRVMDDVQERPESQAEYGVNTT